MLHDYEIGIKKLIKLSHLRERSKIETLANSLRENLDEEMLFGASEQSRSARNKIIFSLNNQALRLTNFSFNELCNNSFYEDKKIENIKPDPETSTKNATILNQLENSFNMEELATVCFKINIDFEEIPGSTKSAKARELILFAKRTGNIDNLLAIVQEMRPHLLTS